MGTLALKVSLYSTVRKENENETWDRENERTKV